MPYYIRVGYPKSCYMSDVLDLGKMIEYNGNIKYISELIKKMRIMPDLIFLRKN